MVAHVDVFAESQVGIVDGFHDHDYTGLLVLTLMIVFSACSRNVHYEEMEISAICRVPGEVADAAGQGLQRKRTSYNTTSYSTTGKSSAHSCLCVGQCHASTKEAF
jgi:hypothetical protein